MMAAEKWYEYQDSYKRYGIDMKPKTVKTGTIKSKSSNTGINAKDKFRLLLLTAFIGVLCIGVILTTAYAASIKYNINTMIKGKYGDPRRNREPERQDRERVQYPDRRGESHSARGWYILHRSSWYSSMGRRRRQRILRWRSRNRHIISN